MKNNHIKDIKERWDKSKLSQRISATEMHAINHGYPEWFDITISQWWLNEIEKIEKAYGGCGKCYGKGYSTVKMQAKSRNSTTELNPIHPCSCDRGKQIDEILNKQYITRKTVRNRFDLGMLRFDTYIATLEDGPVKLIIGGAKNFLSEVKQELLGEKKDNGESV